MFHCTWYIAILIILLDMYNVANMMQCSYHKVFARLGRKRTSCNGNTSFGRQEKAITQGSSWTDSTLLGSTAAELPSACSGTQAGETDLWACPTLPRIQNKITLQALGFALTLYTLCFPSEDTEKGNKVQFTWTLFSTLLDTAGHLMSYSFSQHFLLK